MSDSGAGSDEESDFKGIWWGSFAMSELGVGKGELEGFGSRGNGEGLAEVAVEGGVFSEDGLGVENVGSTALVPAIVGVVGVGDVKVSVQ